MKDFLLDSNGDIVLKKNDIQFVRDNEAMVQKVRMILGTNKGEWMFNKDEGIYFRAILVKNPDHDQIIDTVLDGLHQVDESFQITEYSFETVERRMVLRFKAKKADGETIALAVGELQKNGTTFIVCALDAETILNGGCALDAISVCNTDTTVFSCKV